ncbi:xanthine dehydrogenase/oxidase-like [Liolophura sinensis]|uniref:xanthine dehydrogenase/oxidase-like n=1 Tax=Liolophura sinensis TaxID=3198878 RepID=UPI003158AECF
MPTARSEGASTPCCLIFYVNGKKIVEKNPDPETTLLLFLRQRLRLTGTKLGCGEGGCGACTVMLSRFDRKQKKILHYSVNSCLYPLCNVHGLAVTTVEGIGSVAQGLHPVQERIAKSHGSQCGFCTPGIVMSMYTLLRNNPLPSTHEMEHAFDGNLCRCTGYRPILDGFRTFTKECAMGENCCKNLSKTRENGDQNGVKLSDVTVDHLDAKDFKPYNPSQEPIFPPELQMSDELDKASLKFEGERATWYRPVTLTQLLELKASHPDAVLVNGNSEIGVEIKFKSKVYPVIIATTHIPELRGVELTDSGVVFGGSVTLTEIEIYLRSVVELLPEHKSRTYVAMLEMLRWFAGHQIRKCCLKQKRQTEFRAVKKNQPSLKLKTTIFAIAGNIMTASPISDLNPILLSAKAVLRLASKDGGYRELKMDHNFFKGYRRTAVKPEEILISVHILFTSETEYFSAYKQSHRRDDDIAIVNAAVRVVFEEGCDRVRELTLSYGGMAPTTVMAHKAMKSAVGRCWDDELLSQVCRDLAEDMPLPPGVPGGMAEYRQTLTASFFFKFYLSVKLKIQNQLSVKSPVPASYHSATPTFHREPTRSLQLYEEVVEGQDIEDVVGRPLPHLSSIKQATGEATYVDDMPPYKEELFLALVLSTKAHANIVSMDVSAALEMPGVVNCVTCNDVPGSNLWGIINQDEQLFADQKVTCQGQVIAGILADTQLHAQRAARAVFIEYEELEPIITIKEAIKAKSFLLPTNSIQKGDLGEGFNLADHIHQGEMTLNGQEHFYLETQGCLVVPDKEDGQMLAFSSTQDVAECQTVIASALGVQDNRIVCKTKRLGGGFGGKETRAAALTGVCAVAANKCMRVVRCVLDRDEDMSCTGTRHPFLGRYKVGYTKTGRVTALNMELYCNAGHTMDLSLPVMERALYHCTNCYNVPNIHAVGYLCRTNLPSNTAFRGFGAPQAMMICENMMTEIANNLGVSQQQVRWVNMLKEGDSMYYNQPLLNFHLPTCWDECLTQSDFRKQQQLVTQFNRDNRWKKRGLSVIPTQFGVAFTSTHMNQGGALLHVYRDGSVLLTHGGVEMGQGLHTKMIQVASRALGIPASKIFIAETSTDKVPNTSPTAASMGSDINGMAVMDACQKIKDRLLPFKKLDPKGKWIDWVTAAYFDRVSLSATGFYKVPGLGYDEQNNKGNPFSYFTTGVACSLVEVDCLTGDHQVLRTDIVMDIGTSLNPAIDIGQIEGAFTQGYGLMLMEQQKVTPSGYLLTRGPGAYKIPSFGDVPVEFNVSLLKGVSNPRAVYSSKATGEPPLFLAASVFYAVKDAIMAARAESGLHGNFALSCPATPERIRMACEDQFTKMFPAAEPGTFKPWYVEL